MLTVVIFLSVFGELKVEYVSVEFSVVYKILNY